MTVARQFIAWFPCENGNRPVGHRMIGFDSRVTIGTINQPGVRVVPDGTDSRLDAFQTRQLSGLATIIGSLAGLSRNSPNRKLGRWTRRCDRSQ